MKYFRLIIPSISALIGIGIPAAGQTQVTLTTASNIQQAVYSYPENTIFTLQSGVYRLQSIQPKNGDQFIGQPGAILNGSQLLTTFTQSGSLWKATGLSQQGQTNGYCDSTHPQCAHPEDLFFDNRPLLAVSSVSAVVAGTWYFDYPNQTIYFGDNPTGHTVEIGTTRSAFSGPASNVTIQGLVIEKYAVPAQFGAIGDQYPGSNWVIMNNQVRLNHGAGIAITNGTQVLDNFIHDNGQEGIAGGGVNPLVQGNEISHNNFAGFDPNWEAAGAKFTQSTGLVVRGNNVHDNYGPGLWFDIDCMTTLIETNTVTSNYAGPGIQYEISYNATIRYNTVRYNYVTNGGWWMWGSQILLQNSGESQVYGNTADVLADRGNGIGIINQDRGSGPYGPRVAQNNYIHNNVIITRQSPQGANGMVADANLGILTTGNNIFDYNVYHVTNSSLSQWAWGQQGYTFAAYQKFGQEVHSTIDTQIPPPGLESTFLNIAQ